MAHSNHLRTKPNSLSIQQQHLQQNQNNNNTADGTMASGSVNPILGTQQQAVDDSWQTDHTINLDDYDNFDLLSYINTDSSPLEEQAPDADDMLMMKEKAQYEQMQLESLYQHEEHHGHFHQHPDMMEPAVQHHNNYDWAGASVPNQHQQQMLDYPPTLDHQEMVDHNQNQPHFVDGGFGPHQSLETQLDNTTLMPSTSRASATSHHHHHHQQLGRMQMQPMPIVKQELVKEEPSEMDQMAMAPVTSAASSRASSVGSAYTTTTSTAGAGPSSRILISRNGKKPRKYRMKPEHEKLNPVYREKRAKNNDAVRRSRDKAKQVQQQKDERLLQLEDETVIQKELIAKLEAKNHALSAECTRMKMNCRCGAGATAAHKSATMHIHRR